MLKSDLKIIKDFAKTLSPYPLRNSKGEFIMVRRQYRVNPKTQQEAPKGKVWETEFHRMKDPVAFLIKAFKKGGPDALPEATRTYLNEYKEAIKALADYNAKQK